MSTAATIPDPVAFVQRGLFDSPPPKQRTRKLDAEERESLRLVAECRSLDEVLDVIPVAPLVVALVAVELVWAKGGRVERQRLAALLELPLLRDVAIHVERLQLTP